MGEIKAQKVSKLWHQYAATYGSRLDVMMLQTLPLKDANLIPVSHEFFKTLKQKADGLFKRYPEQGKMVYYELKNKSFVRTQVLKVNINGTFDLGVKMCVSRDEISIEKPNAKVLTEFKFRSLEAETLLTSLKEAGFPHDIVKAAANQSLKEVENLHQYIKHASTFANLFEVLEQGKITVELIDLVDGIKKDGLLQAIGDQALNMVSVDGGRSLAGFILGLWACKKGKNPLKMSKRNLYRKGNFFTHDPWSMWIQNDLLHRKSDERTQFILTNLLEQVTELKSNKKISATDVHQKLFDFWN